MKSVKSINQMTLSEFKKMPMRRSYNSEEPSFDSIVIIPCEELHDSGYRLLDFVGCIKDKPIIRLSGCSDVLHINGIGGYGFNWLEKYRGVPRLIPPSSWSIDCLPKSGLLRLFCDNSFIKSQEALSSFQIFNISKNK